MLKFPAIPKYDKRFHLICIPLIIFLWSIEVIFLYRKPFAYNFVSFDIVLQMFVFYLLVTLFLSKKINLISLLIATFLSTTFDTTFFSSGLHPFLISHHLYPPFMGYGNTSNQSPEFARILIDIILGIIFLILLGVKKNRTFSRIFMVLIYWSVLLTSFLFHYVVIQSIKYNLKIEEESYRLIINQNNYKDLCQKLNIICFDAREKISISKEIDSTVTEITKLDIKPEDMYFVAQNKVFDKDRNSIFLAGSYNHINEKRILIDKTRHQEMLLFHQKIYSILALAAHLVWILGGLFLIWWHERRKSRRILD